MVSQLYGGRWKLGESLGAGGQGDVFLATDVTGVVVGEVALKRLRDVTRLDRFRREIEALKRLSHKGIVKVVDHSPLEAGDSRHFLVMPYARGGDARRRLPELAGKIDLVTNIAVQIADALGAASEHGVVHRDVKPGNILFPSEGIETWVADFGICRIDTMNGITPEGEVLGARGFSAPEIEEGNSREASPAVDIYSLGQLIFFLFSGGKFFHREDVLSAQHDQYFHGQVGAMMRTLLATMVAPRDNRVSDWSIVLRSLAKIQDWHASDQALALSDGTRSALLNLRNSVIDLSSRREIASRTTDENRALVSLVVKSLLDEIERQLGTILEMLNEGTEVSVALRRTSQPDALKVGPQHFESWGGVQLEARPRTTPDQLWQVNFHLGFIGRRPDLSKPKLPELAIHARYLAGSSSGKVSLHTFVRGESGMVAVGSRPPRGVDWATSLVPIETWTLHTDVVKNFVDGEVRKFAEWLTGLQYKSR